MRETDLAWAAGLVDGEGCFLFVSSGGERKLQFTVGQAGHKELLHRLRRILGAGSITTNGIRKKPQHRQGYRLQVSGYRGTRRVAELLWPYLGNIKRRQYLMALERYEAVPIG